jgi:hypothetical protein
MAAVGITTAGAIFEVSLSALEVIQSTTIVEFSQSGSALAGFETVTVPLLL